MSSVSFKFDKSAFKIQSFEEEENQKGFKHLSVQERLRIAYFLNSIAYNFDPNHPPKMDKTVFKIRKRT